MRSSTIAVQLELRFGDGRGCGERRGPGRLHEPGVGAPAPAPAVAAAPGGSAMAGAGGSGSGAAGLGPIMPVPMNLFATWEIDRSSPSCVPSYIKPNAIVHVCK